MNTKPTPSSAVSIGSFESHISQLPWIVIALTVAIFAGAIVLVSGYFRSKIRDQIISRDGEMLHSVVLMQQYELDSNDPLLASFEDPATQLEIVLKTSRLLRNVVAARLFDPKGTPISAVPHSVPSSSLPPDLVAELSHLAPVNRFTRYGRLGEFFPLATSESIPAKNPNSILPLLEINLPLHNRNDAKLLGIAQFIVSGESVANQFRALDSYLYRQAGAIFITGSLLIVLGLRHAFQKLQRANALLSKRTAELQHANQELVLASKTSAIGAVAAHLIHGLKTPLFGLKNLANECVQNPSKQPGTDWLTAAATAEQMHDLVNTVVRVLQDEQNAVDCEIAFSDLTELLCSRYTPTATTAGIRFSVDCQTQAHLPYRAANLVLLVLQNLIDNAFQATPHGREIRLRIGRSSGPIVCEVSDQGPGVPADCQKILFAPCRSTKPHSSGIGLAISKQLANHLGARLELKRSTPEGSVFALILPEDLVCANHAAFAA